MALSHNTSYFSRLGDTCFESSILFTNKVSVHSFSEEYKQEAVEFYSQYLPMHSRDDEYASEIKIYLPRIHGGF